MNTPSKILASVGLAACALAAAPVSAQSATKVATVDTSRAIIGTNALRTAYESITTTYKAQIDQRTAKQQQLSELLKPFDANGNSQLDDAELPAVQGSKQFTQIQQLEGEVNSLANQVNVARIFAVEQIFEQYGPALQEVATAQKIQLIMPVAAVLYGSAETDVTTQVTTLLNTKVPSVGVVPPQNYRPSQQGAGLFQEIQERLLTAQLIQQQRAQQGQAEGNTQAPAGR